MAVDIDKLLCNQATFLTKEGYGGKPMNQHPIYDACLVYMVNKSRGREILTGYVKKMFKKYGDKTTHNGGIRLLWWVEDIINNDIDYYVNRCFNLFESLNRNYKPEKNKILVRERNGKYYLSDGHHRVAMLYALGYEKVENVFIKK